MNAASHKDNVLVPFIAIRHDNPMGLISFLSANSFMRIEDQVLLHPFCADPGVMAQQKRDLR
jgi:hypothetical protein